MRPSMHRGKEPGKPSEVCGLWVTNIFRQGYGGEDDGISAVFMISAKLRYLGFSQYIVTIKHIREPQYVGFKAVSFN
jgi:hypothetical protein